MKVLLLRSAVSPLRITDFNRRYFFTQNPKHIFAALCLLSRSVSGCSRCSKSNSHADAPRHFIAHVGYRRWYGGLQVVGLNCSDATTIQISRIWTSAPGNFYDRTDWNCPYMALFQGDSPNNCYGSSDIYWNNPLFGNESELTSARIGTCVG